MPDRKIGLSPNHPDHRMNGGMPWAVEPGESGYDEDEEIWTVWEEAPEDDDEHQWVPAGYRDRTAAEARQLLAKLDAELDPELAELIEQLADPSCDHVGPYEKSGDNEDHIKGLFELYGYHINDEGYAVPDGAEDDEDQAVLRVVAVDAAHSTDPDAFEYPDKRRSHADEPIWAVWEHDGGEWSEVESGLTLREAEDS
jgi:hypothetical protein